MDRDAPDLVVRIRELRHMPCFGIGSRATCSARVAVSERIVGLVLAVIAGLWCAHPLVVVAQAHEGTWKLVEVIDYENKAGWVAQNAGGYWKFEHSYGQGSYSAKVWHKSDKDYFAYGAKAVWSKPPGVIRVGEKVSLTVSLSETENTHKWNTSAASSWADFAPPSRGLGARGDVPFANAAGLTDLSINGAATSSASDTFVAVAPEGREGSRVALRLTYFMGTSMATYYVYEWQSSQAPASAAKPSAGDTPSPKKVEASAPAPAKRQRGAGGVAFAGLSGQVEVRPGNDEDAWDFAKMGMVLNAGDHIRTGPRSSVILSFPDLSTYVMPPNTEIILSAPGAKESKLSIVFGNIWANIKQMAKDGTMEVTMNQGVLGQKGTTFACEDDGTTSTVKVIEGSVDFTAKTDGKKETVGAGEMISATAAGLGSKTTFDVKAEQVKWEEIRALAQPHGQASSLIAVAIGCVAIVVALVILYVVRRNRTAGTQPSVSAVPR